MLSIDSGNKSFGHSATFMACGRIEENIPIANKEVYRIPFVWSTSARPHSIVLLEFEGKNAIVSYTGSAFESVGFSSTIGSVAVRIIEEVSRIKAWHPYDNQAIFSDRVK
ncbi:hypothetical protein TorRG33x02_073880 [Trema orientale]|uniref:Uncharacterized protein n=1 Tax=Trema orientale TaxID=63057 RepID=A0A2P5FGV6_TREOI|nr:hypothetical protein TorRG33x02_073880 [Trema orientale]